MDKTISFLRLMSETRTILSEDEDWLQLTQKEQHRIIWDISLKYYALSTMWVHLTSFITNYRIWLEKYVRPLSTDRYSMWQQWAEMLRELHTGF